MTHENDAFSHMGSFTNYFSLFLLYLFRNCSNPKIKGAIVFYEQGPQSFDYSIRLNHTWAFSGFPDVTTIMDTNGPFLNDLELGVSAVPTMQYSISGFLTVCCFILIQFLICSCLFLAYFITSIIYLNIAVVGTWKV